MPSKAAQALLVHLENQKKEKYLSLETCGELLGIAEKRVKGIVERGNIFDENSEKAVVTFGLQELEEGKKLGVGGFCRVNAVAAFNIAIINKRPPLHSREFMAMQCIREECGPRYAIKKLSDETRSDRTRFLQGIADLIIEARLLAVIHHDNIVKLRGYGNCGFMHRDFFIILDRLRITLDKQLIYWRENSKRAKSCSCFSSNKAKETEEDIFDDKLTTAVGVAAAVEYLHSKNIIYRDLKPENIGFDVRDNVKVFDFGLATEVNPSNAYRDGTFKLTGFTGSPLYMAPEVAKMLPYNFKADVYSFGILLWQIMSTKVPYEKLTLGIIEREVINGNHRPKIDSSWSMSLSGLMRSCWARDMAERPNFAEIKGKIQIEGFGDTDMTQKSKSNLDISTKSYRGILMNLNNQ